MLLIVTFIHLISFLQTAVLVDYSWTGRLIVIKEFPARQMTRPPGLLYHVIIPTLDDSPIINGPYNCALQELPTGFIRS